MATATTIAPAARKPLHIDYTDPAVLALYPPQPDALQSEHYAALLLAGREEAEMNRWVAKDGVYQIDVVIRLRGQVRVSTDRNNSVQVDGWIESSKVPEVTDPGIARFHYRGPKVLPRKKKILPITSREVHHA